MALDVNGDGSVSSYGSAPFSSAPCVYLYTSASPPTVRIIPSAASAGPCLDIGVQRAYSPSTSASQRCNITIHPLCRLNRLYTNGTTIITPAGGAVNARRERRLIKLATRAEDKRVERRKVSSRRKKRARYFECRREGVRRV